MFNRFGKEEIEKKEGKDKKNNKAVNIDVNDKNNNDKNKGGCC